ncbi:hypothetical protein HDU93_005910 [Gonapodya sp. JEL0774]|nr:hypothetical protein HDU93_005910 [Gonapodya sp. JEL0774]
MWSGGILSSAVAALSHQIVGALLREDTGWTDEELAAMEELAKGWLQATAYDLSLYAEPWKGTEIAQVIQDYGRGRM